MLVVLYSCNQEEDISRVPKPSDGGEVMTTASGTLTPAELLAQDPLLIDLFNVLEPYMADTYSQLHEDSTWLTDLDSASSAIYNSYSGWNSGMTQEQKELLIDDALGIISDGHVWPDPINISTRRSPFEKCIRSAKRRFFRKRGLTGVVTCNCCDKYDMFEDSACDGCSVDDDDSDPEV